MADMYNGPHGLTRRGRFLLMSNWYLADDLLRTCYELKNMNSNVQSNRDTMATKLNSIALEIKPYNATTRFVEGKEFVCEAHGSWSGLFSQLRSALYHKDRLNVTSRGEGGISGNGRPDSKDEQSHNDAFVAIQKALDSMIAKILNSEDLLTQFQFEAKLQQNWTHKNGDKWEVVLPKVMPGDETDRAPTIPA